MEKVNDDRLDHDSLVKSPVWRKLDLYVLPLASVFYLLSFLDRANIGNARVAGLQTDLHLTNLQYTTALTMTYIPYIAIELPSNLILKFVGPHIILPTLLVLWGLVTTLQGFVHDYSGLLICRFFLGLLEGGLLPGLILYLSFFYPRQLLHWRISVFFSTASLTGAFSGLLAFGILHMDGIGHQKGWSWIFILEGVFTSCVGIISFFLLPQSPAHARFLSVEEKSYIASVLEGDGSTSKDEMADSFSWREVGEAFTLPQVWLLALAAFFGGATIFALAYFTPSIVQGLGYTVMRTQLMTVPPFAVSFIVSLAVSYVSDRYHCRGAISIFCAILCIIGFSLFFASENHHVQYASLFFSISGTYNASPAIFTWNANNTAPHTRRATAIALITIVANAGGILATWLLGVLSPAPRYFLATKVLLSFSVLMMVAFILNAIFLWDQNRRKAKIRLTLSPSKEKPDLGDRSAWFTYHL